jgi:hypothetical protein
MSNHKTYSRRKAASSTGEVVAGAMLGGALVALTAGIMSAARSRNRPAGPVVGGVSLSGVDLTRPFVVNLSIPSSSTYEKKVEAYRRALESYQAFSSAGWRVDRDFRPQDGHFVFTVSPNSTIEQRIARQLLSAS